MMNTQKEVWCIFIIAGSEENADFILKTLEPITSQNITTEWASTIENARTKLNSSLQDEFPSYDAVLVVDDLQGIAATDILEEIRGCCPAPLILLSKQAGEDFDLQAIESGAMLLLAWNDLNPLLLERSIRYCIKHKHVEEDLITSERAFRDLVRFAPAAIYEIDFRKQRFTSVNNSMCELSGYSREELLAMDPFDLLDEDGKRRFQIRIKHWLSGQKPEQNVEYQIKAKDGRLIDTELNSTFIKDKNGKPLGATVVAFDITDRKQTEKSLTEERLRTQQILNSITDGFFELNQQWEITYINQVAARNAGFEPDQLIGKNLWEMFPSIRNTDQETIFRQVMEHRQQLHTNLHGADTDKWYDYRVYPSEAGITVFWTNITEQKTAEQAAAQNEAKLITALESMSDAVCITDANGNLINFNQAFATFNRFSSKEECATRFVEYPKIIGAFWPDGSIAPVDMWAVPRALRGEVATNAEYLFLRKETGERWFGSLSFAPIRNDDQLIIGSIVVARDTTEQKLASQALETAHAELINERNRLMAVVQAIPIALALQDIHGGVTLANQAYEDVWGSPRPHAETVDDYDLYQAWWAETDERVEPHEWASALAVESGISVTDQFIRIQRFDGKQGYILNSGAPILDAYGAVIGGVVTIIDITDRVLAEKALKDSEERFRLSSMSVEGVLYDISLDRKNVYQSEGLERVTGYKPGEEPGGSGDWWIRNIHPDDYPHVQERLQEALDQGMDSMSYEYRIRHRDDYWVYVEDRVHIVRDEKGTPVRLLGTATDISKRKHAEEALRESEGRFRVALTSLPITVYMVDHQLRYTWIHNHWGGKPDHEILGKRDDEILPEDTASEIMALKRSVIDSGQSLQKEISITFNGRRRQFMLSLEPLRDVSGKIMGLLGATLDVTEQRRIENERRDVITKMEIQRQLMEFREKERQEIARDIHDGPIQTLVSAMFNIQVAKGAVQDPALLLEMEQLSNSVQGAVRELREVMNELRPPALLRFGLAKSIRSHVEGLRDRQQNLDVHLDLKEDFQSLSPGLTLTLFRIYQEAITNILRHSDANRVTIRLFRQSKKAILEIQDNGKGFDTSKDLAQSVRAGHYGVAGMNERAEAVGGRFTIQSTPGEGTTIRVQVPINVE